MPHRWNRSGTCFEKYRLVSPPGDPVTCMPHDRQINATDGWVSVLPVRPSMGSFPIHPCSQDADLPPLEEKHLDGKFDPAVAVHEASAGCSGAPPAAPLLRARDLRLKGADAMIYLCAARLGLRPVVLRLVWDECNQVMMDRLGWVFGVLKLVQWKSCATYYARLLRPNGGRAETGSRVC